jgi:hypothetical protein
MPTLEHIALILAILVGCYEVVVRIVPTVKDRTLIGNIFAVLKYISDLLNRPKKFQK